MNDYLREVSRVIDECERRNDITDLTVITYMLRRIRSCSSTLKTLEFGQGRLDTPLINPNELNELINVFSNISDHWKGKKVQAESMASFSDIKSIVCAEKVYCGMKGRPKFIIDHNIVDNLMQLRFNKTQIARILNVSRTTLWRHIGNMNSFTEINDDDLDRQVIDIKKMHPDSGERIIEGILRSRKIDVQRRRVRESVHRVDPVNAALRWLKKNPRWKYSVPGPNSLWHNDGLHKLIRWGFVIHACMDGYSRLITSLLCTTNNRADTCLQGFQEGVARYGIPERVRGDNGGENNGVEMFMMKKRGGGSYLRDHRCTINASSVFIMIQPTLF